MKYQCTLSQWNNPSVSFPFEMDSSQSLFNNIRRLTRKSPEQLRYIVPEELYQDIQNGKTDYAIQAEYVSASSQTAYTLDPMIVLGSRQNEFYDDFIKDTNGKNHPNGPDIRLIFKGYPLPDCDAAHANGLPGKESSDLMTTDSTSNKKTASKNSKKSGRSPKKKGTFLLIALLLCAIAAGAFWFLHDTSFKDMSAALEAGNLIEVVSIYNERIYESSKQQEKADKTLIRYMDDSIQQALDEKISYDEGMTASETLGQLNNPDLSGLAMTFQACTQFSAKQYTDTVSLYNTYICTSKSNRSYIDSAIKDLLDSTAKQYEEETLSSDEAIRILTPFTELVISELSDIAQAHLNTIETSEIMLNYLEDGDAAYSEGKFVEAVSSYCKISESSSLYASAKEKMDTCCQSILESAQSTGTVEQYLTFITKFLEIKNYSASTAVSDCLSQLQTECTNQITKETSALVKEHNYAAALVLIESAASVYEDSNLSALTDSISSKQKAYEAENADFTNASVDFIKKTDEIKNDADVKTYPIKASVTGTYTLHFTEMYNGFSVYAAILNEQGETIEDAYSRSNDETLSERLEAGKTYKVVIHPRSSTGSYNLSIGTPKKTVDISKHTNIIDSIEYYKQTNSYTFTPSVSGIYRFDFSDMMNGFSVHVDIRDHLDNEVESSRLSNSEGITASLNAGEQYTIYIYQDSDLGNYKMTIGKQKPEKTIALSETISDSIKYTSQRNVYKLEITSGGEYSITVGNMLNDTSFSVWIQDKQKYNKFDSSMSSGDTGTATLEAGQTYTVFVQQRDGFTDYDLKIYR